MSKHTAKSLFAANILGAEECVRIHDGVRQLGSTLDLDWLLRSAIVLAVSAMDAYFHDKVRYRAGRFPLYQQMELSTQFLPRQLANLKVPLSELPRWEKAKRKGNVVRHWAVEHYAVRPLQNPEAIANALNLAGIEDLWNTVEPDKSEGQALLDRLRALVKRRNQIAHEGDRLKHRSSGQRLRAIRPGDAVDAIEFVKALVEKVEHAFPK